MQSSGKDVATRRYFHFAARDAVDGEVRETALEG
jgi:hypothetical protein